MSRTKKPPIDKKMAVKIKEQIFRRTPGIVIEPTEATLGKILIGSFFVTLEKKGGEELIFEIRDWRENGNWAIVVYPLSDDRKGERKYRQGILGITEMERNSFFWAYRPQKSQLERAGKDATPAQKAELKKRTQKRKKEAHAKAAAYFKRCNKNALETIIIFPKSGSDRFRFFEKIFRIANNVIGADKAAEDYYFKKGGKTKASKEENAAKNRRAKPKPRQSEAAFEGGKVVVTHKKFERNSQFARSVKDAYEADDELMPCQICEFSFLDIYGEEGRGFIEAHHLVPLARGKRETQKGDIALVCANCHRVIHRHLAKKPKNPEAWMLEIEGLKKILQRNRKG